MRYADHIYRYRDTRSLDHIRYGVQIQRSTSSIDAELLIVHGAYQLGELLTPTRQIRHDVADRDDYQRYTQRERERGGFLHACIRVYTHVVVVSNILLRRCYHVPAPEG